MCQYFYHLPHTIHNHPEKKINYKATTVKLANQFCDVMRRSPNVDKKPKQIEPMTPNLMIVIIYLKAVKFNILTS